MAWYQDGLCHRLSHRLSHGCHTSTCPLSVRLTETPGCGSIFLSQGLSSPFTKPGTLLESQRTRCRKQTKMKIPKQYSAPFLGSSKYFKPRCLYDHSLGHSAAQQDPPTGKQCSHPLAEWRTRSFRDGSSPGSTSYYSVARARTDWGFNSFSGNHQRQVPSSQTTQDDAHKEAECCQEDRQTDG